MAGGRNDFLITSELEKSRTKAALLFSLLVSLTLVLLPQQTAAINTTLATTD